MTQGNNSVNQPVIVAGDMKITGGFNNFSFIDPETLKSLRGYAKQPAYPQTSQPVNPEESASSITRTNRVLTSHSSQRQLDNAT